MKNIKLILFFILWFIIPFMGIYIPVGLNQIIYVVGTFCLFGLIFIFIILPKITKYLLNEINYLGIYK